MKRSRLTRRTPLKSTTQLHSNTPLQARTPLRSTARLVTRTPLRAVSLQRQRENRERRQVIAATHPDGPVICAVPWCDRIGDSPHEPLTRARGGSITDPDNIVLICWPHNQELTLEPPWGYELGLLKHSWETE